MKKWIKLTALLAVIGLVTAILGYVFVYNKPHPDFEKKSAEFSMTASQLFEDFVSDETSAAFKYNGKMISLTGTLSSVEKTNTLTIAVFSIQEGLFGAEGIRINMLENQVNALSEVKIGQKVSIKGFVTGYNQTDVILEHGSIIEN